jgi:2-amino-4-hydroxy-6-hydroxymethyldihydropteridine diphosphokinase
MIGAEAGFIRALSSVYETEPWEMTTNNLFLNMALEIETALNPHTLLETLLDIENKMGRLKEGTGYSSRIIDIDILFFNNFIINNKNLIIPHPLIVHRRFVLEPLAEIAPQFIHSSLEKSIESLLELCADSCVVRKFYKSPLSAKL